MSNYIHYKVWDDITYPFLNFNGTTIGSLGILLHDHTVSSADGPKREMTPGAPFTNIV